jgi:hypothetical protein
MAWGLAIRETQRLPGCLVQPEAKLPQLTLGSHDPSLKKLIHQATQVRRGLVPAAWAMGVGVSTCGEATHSHGLTIIFTNWTNWREFLSGRGPVSGSTRRRFRLADRMVSTQPPVGNFQVAYFGSILTQDVSDGSTGFNDTRLNE